MANGAPSRDKWDRVQVLAGLLVPAAIALAGHFIGQAIKEAEIASQERRSDLDRALAREGVRVSQANLINTLMKSLTSPNPSERRLAVQAVLIALPEEGPTLARAIEQSDSDKSVQDGARSSIGQRIDSLMQQLFSDDASTRKSAAIQLVQGWRNDPSAANAILDFASSRSTNENGMYNTAVVLLDFSTAALTANRSHVNAFISVAKKIGPNTAARATSLQERLGT